MDWKRKHQRKKKQTTHTHKLEMHAKHQTHAHHQQQCVTINEHCEVRHDADKIDRLGPEERK
jgi:hypothetical protein